MSEDQFQLRIRRDATAFVRAWLPTGAVRGVVQIVHGMAEHGGRYARFARVLNQAGFAVYAQDLPGHGRTARAPDELGHFADNHGWRLAMQSIRAVELEVLERHPGLPLTLFGHSLGSYLTQEYIVTHGNSLSAVILSATSGELGRIRKILLPLLRTEALFGGVGYPSAVADKLTYRRFNRQFGKPRTPHDWLSRDPAEVDRYVADPHCGFRASCGLWIEMMVVCGYLRDARRLARIPRELPILMINGSADPVTGGEKGPRILEAAYRKTGLSTVEVKIYPDARHELLNEICRDEVTQDVLQWLDQQLAPSSR